MYLPAPFRLCDSFRGKVIVAVFFGLAIMRLPYRLVKKRIVRMLSKE